MEEEEEDRILLSSLGVTSANPADIEHHILTEVKKDAGERNEAEGSNLEHHDGIKDSKSSSSDLSKLYNKLRAVEFEIEAVAASGEQAKNIKRNELNDSDEIDDREREDAGEIKSDAQAFANDLTLQYALTADRLNSLKKTRVRLLKEIEELDKDNSTKSSQDGKLISDLVKEERRLKRKLKEDQSSSKNSKKQLKKVTINEDDEFDAVLDAASAGFVETERDELVRKGILTPFHKLKGFERRVQQPGPSSRHNMTEEEAKAENVASISVAKAVRSFSEAARARSTTKLLEANALPKLDAPTRPFQRLKMPVKLLQPTKFEKSKAKRTKKKRPLPGKRWTKVLNEEEKLNEEEDAGDGMVMSDNEEENQDDEDVDDNESHFVVLEGGLKIPEAIFSKLFDYQKVGVQWLWELHCQRAGGIIGDEMGLGKTIQVLSFLGALHFSKMYKPSIVVCPVTLLRQWRREARKWYPSFHVEILHDSAKVAANRQRADLDASDDESEGSLDSDDGRTPPSKTTNRWDSLINRVLRSESGLLITTYEQIRILGDKLLDIQWGYAILDEGHRIRNPNAEVTLVCKQLQTVHRIIMTGAPIQNKLSELWSLFDFVFPGKLGVLPVFEAEFAVPISVGGYANATPLQVSTAYRCAVVLRDLIMPYLLRRMKADVNAQLPKKTEHVLFCSLTAEQRTVYRAFLASSEVEQIFDGSKNSLYGIDIMRKICNHPDLLERDHASSNPDYGNPDRSGKMKVVAQVLKLWKDQGHRVLLFAQTQQMLDILENFLIANGYTYRRMDGLTPVKQRMALMDEFNDSDDIFIFILTTKVGGLGTNLTGGNRVIIFDPDWNPSTDMQARERAWRIGQTRDVTIYRLITRGTIEEKVYHRQIYKHFLTNKILKNPQQKRFFKSRDMKDLFTLVDGEDGSTETSNIFKQLSDEANILEGHKDDQEKQGTINATESCTSTSAVERETKPAPGSSQRSGKERADQSDGDTDQETDILKSLFHTHGIHSAMNHDVLMNAHDDEKMRLEEQASQVAQRAAEALRQSRMLRSQDGISVPTWTGRSGAAGAPSSVRKKFGSTLNSQLIGNSKSSGGSSGSGMNRPNGFAAGASVGKALSSTDLLAKIRGTQERAVSDGLEHQLLSASRSTVRTQPNADVGPSRTTHKAGFQPEVLVRQICTFIQQRGGRSSSAILVQHFKDRIPSTDLALFKNLLKEIAFLEKDPNGSSWVLKPEYL